MDKVPNAQNYLSPVLKYCQYGAEQDEITLEPVPEVQPVSTLDQLLNSSSEDENNGLPRRELFTDSPQSKKSHTVNIDQVIDETFWTDFTNIQ